MVFSAYTYRLAMTTGILSGTTQTRDEPGLQLGGAIATVAEAAQRSSQIRQEKHIDTRIRWDFLHEAEIARVTAKGTAPEQLQRVVISPEDICAAGQIVYSIDDEIEIIQHHTRRIEKISRNASCRPQQKGRQLSKADRDP